MKLSETYLVKNVGHLWVVCSLPTADGSIAVVSITSHRDGSDENCLVNPGDHSYIAKPSVVAYEYGQILSRASQDKVDGMPGPCPRKGPVSDALLNRIQLGALRSDLTPQKVQAVIRESMARQQR